ncbi:MAG TPA: hypothetical protein V6C65_40250 [Allocoleopsis sp.]
MADLFLAYAPGGLPRYWRDEVSGRMLKAVEGYINRAATAEDLAIVQAYFKHWINAPGWDANPHQTDETRQQLETLRQSIDALTDQASLERWEKEALKIGIDPL